MIGHPSGPWANTENGTLGLRCLSRHSLCSLLSFARHAYWWLRNTRNTPGRAITDPGAAPARAAACATGGRSRPSHAPCRIALEAVAPGRASMRGSDAAEGGANGLRLREWIHEPKACTGGAAIRFGVFGGGSTSSFDLDGRCGGKGEQRVARSAPHKESGPGPGRVNPFLYM